jgi:hypothetical protein
MGMFAAASSQLQVMAGTGCGGDRSHVWISLAEMQDSLPLTVTP